MEHWHVRREIWYRFAVQEVCYFVGGGWLKIFEVADRTGKIDRVAIY